MKISLLKNAYDKTSKATIEFESYIDNIKNGVWVNQVIEIRSLRQKYKAGEIEKAVYQKAKEKVQAVAASGTFSYLNAQGLMEHSGIIAIDFDEEDNPEGIDISQMAADGYTYAIHRSIGGDGLAVYVKIDPKKHLESFEGLKVYYANTYKAVVDKSCKDVSRLRYVSSDEMATIHHDSKVFKSYIEVKAQIPQNRVFTQQPNDIEHIINQVVNRNIDMVSNYDDWLNVGFGFAREYGEGGRSYFHSVSATSTKYDYQATDKKYTHILKRCAGSSASGKQSTIGSFVWLAHQAGLETKTPKTVFIESRAKYSVGLIGLNGHAGTIQDAKNACVEQLKIDGISEEESAPIFDKVASMTPEQRKNSLVGDLVKDTEMHITQQDLKYNEILKVVEYKGEPLTDYATNGLFIDALKVLKDSQKGKTLGRELFETMLNSPIVKRYNPFNDFFRKNKPQKGREAISELLNCLELNNYNEEDTDFLQLCVMKWLVSIVASMHGTHSVLCLVLCSKMGKGKTKFFRNLLPPELLKYYTESNLDRDKDSDIEMCENLLICDDEFEGKSKADAKKLKALLSKQNFKTRAAYARRAEKYDRIAVLCGTSNEEDVLNDLEGNRRIIPVNVKDIDFDRYDKIDKNQLFMELLDCYEDDKIFFMLTAEDIARLNKTTVKNEEACMELEAFSMYFGNPEDYQNYAPIFYTPTQIKVEIENASKTLKLSLKKLGAVMKKLGIAKIAKKAHSTVIYGYKIVKLID